MSTPTPIDFPDDFLGRQAQAFESGAKELKDILDQTLEKLKDDPSNPGLLAAYQTAFSSYTVFRNVQTNTTKGFKDIDMSTIQAAR
ncbi:MULTISPECIES: type III secretion system needle filament subunit SctF [Pseudomonas]|uniref:Type III secretion system major needle protein, YscF/MxiH/PrgI family n=1 Tax=Pseudomonas asplenii TaxID=53407 RepID=A0A0N1J610_9PSED|nr:type III secretion system needle filament subunit SctF [Pseudomonas fuscovaginae]KPA90799.1 type III secretion system major needle protein, YscF/MxiH/PrgI family [Pseudomonas fuscovaginae]KPA96209.1 type III secretion system major needle protein, YscF/MxiH/PrgI family [Pseudomonas fuscovaginae]